MLFYNISTKFRYKSVDCKKTARDLWLEFCIGICKIKVIRTKCVNGVKNKNTDILYKKQKQEVLLMQCLLFTGYGGMFYVGYYHCINLRSTYERARRV